MLSLLLTILAADMPGADTAAVLKALQGKEYFSELVTLKDGEPKGGHAAVVVVRPVAPILGVLRDIDNYKTVFPHFVDSKVLTRVGRMAQAHLEAELDVAFAGIGKLWADVQYLERTDPNGSVWVRQRMLPGRGSFTLYELDVRLQPLPQEEGRERTLVEVWALVKPDIPLVPTSILEHENHQAARQSARALRLRTLGVPYVPKEL